MTININELREIGATMEELSELLDRLEAAEEERDELRALVVMRFDHDCPPQFTQGYALHELIEPVTAEHCRWFVAEIERLRTDRDELHAKIAEMERQEIGFREKCTPSSPAGYSNRFPLYTLPGTQGETK